MALFAVIQGGVALSQVASGLWTFNYSAEAGGAAVAYLAYTAGVELLWRTKEAKDTMKTSAAPSATGDKSADKKKKTYTYDRSTTFMCGLTLAGTAVSANVSCIKQQGPTPGAPLAAKAVAAAGMVVATVLRRSAMLTLGSRFSAALAKTTDHTICSDGVYAWCRHPGYTANIVLITSYAYLVTGNPIQTGVHFAAALACWLLRVSVEEQMLLGDEDLGAPYREYSKKVRAKFFPFLL